MKETPLRRELRSSQSFHTLTETSCPRVNSMAEDAEPLKDTTPRDDNEPLFSSQTSTISTSSRNSLPNMKGKDLFDSIIWADKLTTSIFYTFISSLRQKILNDVKSTTVTHKFIRALRDGGKLVRNYTQNIDMLEAREGLCTELSRGTGTRGRFNTKLQKELRTGNDHEGGIHDSGVEVVHLHGSLDSLRCGLCARLTSWEDEDRHATTLSGEAPDCPWCTANSAKREGKGRRSLAIGRLRPDIVLYGEEHPSAHLVGPLITHDLSLGPDILLILGTSLRVHGLKVMVREFAKAVHGRGGSVVFVNQTKPPDSIWGDVIDYWIEWDCDAWVADLKERREDIWLPQGTKSEVPKEDKPQVPAKNPMATRRDVTNGAYVTRKILTRLRKLTGRGEDEEAAKRIERLNGIVRPAKLPKLPKQTVTKPATVAKPTEPVTVQIKEAAPPVQEPMTPPASEDSSKRKRKSLPRPSAVRDDKANGAHLTFSILHSLHILTGRDTAVPPTTPVSSVRNEKQIPRAPLSRLSTNALGGRRRQAKGKCKTVQNRQSQLPSPPTSDGAGPHSDGALSSRPPMTPETQRIKRLLSISAILSSPLSSPPPEVIVWGN